MSDPLLIPQVRYQLLSQPQEIRAYAATLQGESTLAIDMEADSLFSYREKVCLVQISTASANTILDPLSGNGVLALADVFADASMLKVFHGADYDLRLLKREYGFAMHNVADTMIAAQFTGRQAFGLGALLEELFGLHVDKRFQRANWAVRPLDAAHLSYAALDTAYLLELWRRLRAELVELGRMAWAEEEFRLLEAVASAPEQPVSCFDVKGAGHLRGRQLAILQALVEVRDETARAWDRPPFKVLSNQVLLDWAEQPPEGMAALLKTRAANRGVLQHMATKVLAAIRRAASVPPEEWPRRNSLPFTPLSAEQQARLERLKAARERVATRLGLSTGLLVNNQTLEKLSRLSAQEAAQQVQSSLKRWQVQAVGDDLLRAL